MAQFTVRVELHHATQDDYSGLHDAMQQRGFSRVIQSDDGRRWHLPWAEYDVMGQVSRSAVLAAAKEAAASTGRSNAVLVTESAGRLWDGLVQAK